MLVLALDTSSPAVSAALVRVAPGTCEAVAEHVVVDARRHGELLALGVREVLAGRPATVWAPSWSGSVRVRSPACGSGW